MHVLTFVHRLGLRKEARQDVIDHHVVLLLEAGVRDAGHDGELLVHQRRQVDTAALVVDSHGARTLFGVHTHGYPNLFIMGGYQASFQFNLTFMLQTQGDHIAECIALARKRGAKEIDVSPQTEEWWVQEVIAHRGKTSRNADCTPGYYNFEGEFNRRQDGNYNGGFLQYYTHMQEVRGDLEKHFLFG